MARTRSAIGVLCNLVVVWGCGDGSAEQRDIQIDTLETGVIVVQNGATGVWDAESRWSLEPLVRIGTVAGSGPEMFGTISALTLDPLGRAWVFDGQAAELRVFDSEGEYVRTVGGPGEGPGEFAGVEGLKWSPTNHLWAVDQRLGRVSVFDTTGAFIKSHPSSSLGHHQRWPGSIDESGRFYEVHSDFSGQRRTFLVRRDSLFSVLDTLYVPGHPEGPQVWARNMDGQSATVAIPYGGSVGWAVTRDGGLWAAVTDQYELLRLSPAGDTLRRSSKSFSPVPLVGEELEDALDVQLFGETIPRSMIPESKPALSRILLDDQDHLWVVPMTETEESGEAVQVFNPEGIYLGEMRSPVPLDAGPVDIRRGRLLAVERDRFGVEYVVMLGVNR